MGLILGLGAGAFFALSTIFARVGHRRRFDDDGVFMSILVNVVALGLVAPASTMPPWSWTGVAGLVAGGIVGTLGGRSASLRAVRLIGPSRANAFQTGMPVPAAIFGWLVLGERVALIDAMGGAFVIAGLLWLVKARSSGESLLRPGSAPGRGQTPLAGYLFAVAAPTLFGLAFVIRKWGLLHLPDAVIGALIGAVGAFAAFLLLDALRGQLRARLEGNLRQVPWWFVATGLATTAALLCQYTAFSYLPAWVVGILQGTQGLWTLLFSFLFIRREERLDSTVVGSVLLVVSGVVLIGLQA